MDPDLREFGQRLTGAQFELYAFICVLMEGENDAADVLQETNLALWNHAEEYDCSRPFLPWARSFAYNQVRAFRLKQARSRLVFDERLLAWFAEHAGAADGHTPSPVASLGALERCLGRLNDRQRQVVRLKYTENLSLKEMAETLGHSVTSVGVLLHRTRLVLALCMRRLGTERRNA